MKENRKTISGFSKMRKRDKIKWLVENFFKDPEAVAHQLKNYWLKDEADQKILDGFSENTISNFPLPYGVAPNFQINDSTYAVPMVIEESSVVAAAASAAKFWMRRGGFKAQVIKTLKIGQIHFKWNGDFQKLKSVQDQLEEAIYVGTKSLTSNMDKRGGGIKKIELIDFSHAEKDYYQLRMSFETCESMGANFINSVLEQSAIILEDYIKTKKLLESGEGDVEMIMAILSNYTPECLVRVWVQCKVEELGHFREINADQFADRFYTALRIAWIDPYRAATHNKGIFNGVDAVALATGQDFRAIEACGHAYAARDGQYRSLSQCSIEDGIFKFWMDLPLAVGTVGGLTSLHPMAKRSLELLDHPSAEELMMIIAVTGLAQNFGAIKSLVTTGIQKGHMKLHMENIMNHLGATEGQKTSIRDHFKDTIVTYNDVRDFLQSIEVSSEAGEDISIKS